MNIEQIKEISREKFDKRFVYRLENPIDIMTKPDDNGDRVEVNGEFGKIKDFIDEVIREAVIIREEMLRKCRQCDDDGFYFENTLCFHHYQVALKEMVQPILVETIKQYVEDRCEHKYEFYLAVQRAGYHISDLDKCKKCGHIKEEFMR